MSDVDFSRLKGFADEAHWTEFVLSVGGELFSSSKVVAELKILETEFAHTQEMFQKVDALIRQYPGKDPEDPSAPLRAELISLLRKPLQRTINKANRQIKETKQELGLTDWRGITICVNDNFRGVPPELAIGLFGSILARTSYTNTDAFIYQTNHYGEISSSPYAHLLWSPMYSPNVDAQLVAFVNDLGRKWRDYAERIDGPYDTSVEQDSLDLAEVSVITGVYRNKPFVE